MFPERFRELPEYAFSRLRSLLDGHPAGAETLEMSIGEPRHEFPKWIVQEILENVESFGRYPANFGDSNLLGAISDWIRFRYGVSVDPETRIVVLNGTREGMFNVCIALCPERKNGAQPRVLIPNPFYQVYSAAALAAGAKPVCVPANEDNSHLPDYAALPSDILQTTSILYICSPSNPQGAVATSDYLAGLIELAEKHDFRVFADECYSEIYRGEAPVGILEVAAAKGVDSERVAAFHSLSKRSNVPGLRSGFVAAGPKATQQIKMMRAYSGAPLPTPVQKASESLWKDEIHVDKNRELYRKKFEVADAILGGVEGYRPPDAGFFLWLRVDDGESAALKLWTETGVRVLPGAYLGREANGRNPGSGYIRIALVAEEEEVRRGLEQVRGCLYK